MKIPFDSLCLRAVGQEAQLLVGGRVQKVVARTPLEVALAVYSHGREHWLLLSAEPEFARIHLLTRRPDETLKADSVPAFCQDLRRHVIELPLTAITQRGLDRVVDIRMGDYDLVAELMGKHANLILVRDGKIEAAAKWVGPRQSKRPVLAHRAYSPPPFDPQPPLTDARSGDDLREFEGASPFLIKLIASGCDLKDVQERLAENRFEAWYADGCGAYPVRLDTLGIEAVPRPSISQAIEQAFEERIRLHSLDRERRTLRTQLERILLARDVALQALREAADSAARAQMLQEKGQIILAYASMIGPEATLLEAWDFDGNPIAIPLLGDLSPAENANRLFEKARRAKQNAPGIHQQLARLAEDRAAIEALLARLDLAESVSDVAELTLEADRRRWLFHQPPPTRTKEERPYQGHPIRELLAPHGYKVLYGDNATANDYLTMRVAKPSDWWLHVRGGPSAHVVIQTGNQPDRVPREVLLFAARIAVRQSPQKHAGYVPVDYTLKRYVRKPKGAPPGTAQYTHEKTVHVERDTS